MPMIEITIINSISVKPLDFLILLASSFNIGHQGKIGNRIFQPVPKKKI